MQKAQPGVQGGGEKKSYANITNRERVTLKELSEEIADGRTLTPPDVMAVLISLSRKIPGHLLKGDIVDLGDLGSFTVYLSSKGSVTEDEFDSSMINGIKIIFRTSPDMRKSLKLAFYTKVNGV